MIALEKMPMPLGFHLRQWSTLFVVKSFSAITLFIFSVHLFGVIIAKWSAMKVTFAAVQFSCTWDIEGNLAKAESFVRRAADAGANVILLQELFRTPYFCQQQDPEHFSLAEPLEGNSLIQRFSTLAATLGVVLPISFFEAAGNAFFNSVAVIDADGSVVGHYRKSHIPDGPGYTEKFYFSPGDTGFQAIDTKFGKLGVLICWDQWFPEAARACALLGADVLLYPTAIGSEPDDPEYDSQPHWMRVMQGHAAANMLPVVASNRVGTERAGTSCLTFYGSSFIAGPRGEIVAQVGRKRESEGDGAALSPPGNGEGNGGQVDKHAEGIVTATFDLEELKKARRGWPMFRDRRPDLYARTLTTLDGMRYHQRSGGC